VGKKLDQARKITRDFSSRGDVDLDAQISAFKALHEADHGVLLAMDARQSLGAGRDRITFRVREAPKNRR
jgi:hypothetical protein